MLLVSGPKSNNDVGFLVENVYVYVMSVFISGTTGDTEAIHGRAPAGCRHEQEGHFLHAGEDKKWINMLCVFFV